MHQLPLGCLHFSQKSVPSSTIPDRQGDEDKRANLYNYMTARGNSTDITEEQVKTAKFFPGRFTTR
jgi:hypothetical protein